MPILPDGTIVAPVSIDAPRYVSRMNLEFTYPADDSEEASDIHQIIRAAVLTGCGQIDDMLEGMTIAVEINAVYAKNPQPVLPEGEGAKEGGSVSEGGNGLGDVGAL